MRAHSGTWMSRLVIAAAGATLLFAGPASAASAEHFGVTTTNGCGTNEFVDYGPGAPGGGDNDDYLEIHDYCADGHGVEGYAWLDGKYLGKKYNGNGLAGAPVIWDPFGNVKSGHTIGMKVCNVDGADDATPTGCMSGEFTTDG